MLILGVLATQPGSPFIFKLALLTTMEACGLAGDHHWSLILPTSSRAPQQIYEPVIAIQYPVLHRPSLTDWIIGTGTRRSDYTDPTGFRYIHWDYEVKHTANPTDADKINFEVATEVWKAAQKLALARKITQAYGRRISSCYDTQQTWTPAMLPLYKHADVLRSCTCALQRSKYNARGSKRRQ